MKKNKVILTIVFLGIACFPSFLWGGLFLVGGDDSGLYYLFPYEYFKNFTLQLISDNALGTLGFYFSQAYISSFSLLLALLKPVFSSLNMQFLFFGLNLAFGFLFFYLWLGVFMRSEKDFLLKVTTALLYIFSSFVVTAMWQSHLFSVYLVSLLPLTLLLIFLSFREQSNVYIVLSALTLSIFSVVLFSVPWLVALMIATSPIAILLFFENRRRFVVSGFLFGSLLLLLNFFWFSHFLYSPYSSEENLKNDTVAVGSSTVLSGAFRNIGADVIRSVSKNNNLIYPFLGLFHKSIQEDFSWQTFPIFSQWNMRIFYLNFLLLLPVVAALLFLRRVDRKLKALYLAALASWLIAIFFFTAKIGNWGTDLFVWMNNAIPGFVMFKNMYDKFGLAMAFSHAFLFGISMKIVFDNISSERIKRLGLFFVLSIILFNSKPFIFGDYFRNPIWTTTDTYGSISDFNGDFYALVEYLKKMDEASRFLWMPMNSANYVQISDKNFRNHYYSGVSPLQFLANKSDFNGKLSFPSAVGEEIFDNIKKGNYVLAGERLRQFNVEYAIVNHDISLDLQRSYLFGEGLYESQGEESQKVLLGEKIADFGDRYSLYKISDRFRNEKLYLTGDLSEFPNDFSRIKYHKDASYQYTISITGLRKKEHLVFLDPYHKLWELYFMKDREKFLTGSHQVVFDYANGWTIDPEYIKKNFSKDQYHENPDGSIDLELTLYFKPQSYFYLGLIVSGTTLVACLGYLGWVGVRSWRRKRLEL